MRELKQSQRCMLYFVVLVGACIFLYTSSLTFRGWQSQSWSRTEGRVEWANGNQFGFNYCLDVRICG
jgi:hypothetical protein